MVKDQLISPKITGISAFSFNANQTQVCFSDNSTKVHIYDCSKDLYDASKWKPLHVLEEHTGMVAGIDWNPNTNLIVSCAHDRSAFVWKHDEKEDEWKHILVLSKISRAATAVKWCGNGSKFAIASGAKCVPICYYEPKDDWYISQLIKKHKSTVLAVDWCGNDKFVVTGSTDFRCRIISAFIEDVDDPEDDGFGSVFGEEDMNDFGTVLMEFTNSVGWVNGVSWSPMGFRLAFVGHDSTITLVQLLSEAAPIVQTLKHDGKPFMDVEFLNNNSVMAVGYDCNPVIYVADGDDGNPEWKKAGKVDAAEAKKQVKKKSAFGNAFTAFEDKSKRGQSKSNTTAVLTRHKDYIRYVCPLGRDDNMQATSVATCGMDGRILKWDLSQKKKNYYLD